MDKIKLKYLEAYSEEIRAQVLQIVEQQNLGSILLKRYPHSHQIRTDTALYKFTQNLKNRHLGKSLPISKVNFNNEIHVYHHALGLHTSISRIQGSKLKSKSEIRISNIFKNCPLEFLSMIVCHELAHLKIKDHNKNFYKLCTHLEPSYHQYEFDLRLYLTWLDTGGAPLWSGAIKQAQ